MKKTVFSLILAISLCCVFMFAACNTNTPAQKPPAQNSPEQDAPEEEKLEQVTSEQWKAAIENSGNSKSYSYEAVNNTKFYEYDGELLADFNSVGGGGIDKVSGIAFNQATNNGSVIKGNFSATFGRWYYLLDEQDYYYSSEENADGSFGEWKVVNSTKMTLGGDVLSSIIKDYGLTFIVENEEGENVNVPFIFTDIYDYFTFDEEACCYSATFNYDNGIKQDITISFNNGKICDFYTGTYYDGRIYTATYHFYDYDNTVVELPEELLALSK